MAALRQRYARIQQAVWRGVGDGGAVQPAHERQQHLGRGMGEFDALLGPQLNVFAKRAVSISDASTSAAQDVVKKISKPPAG